MLDDAYRLHAFVIGTGFEIGPFRAETCLLPHWVPNAGLRLTADGRALAYTGDGGPCAEIVDLARGADLLLAEATYVDQVPDDSTGYLTSARQAGEQAARAGVRRLMLTHLWPGTDPQAARSAAGIGYGGPIDVAAPDLTVDLA
jgi:ribonuclease BN (tRNA processing enzyme)